MISFIHAGNQNMASYRYRVVMPARWLGASINDPTAETLVFSKPVRTDPVTAKRALDSDRRVIVDICDSHIYRGEYDWLITHATTVVCATPIIAQAIRGVYNRKSIPIPESPELIRRSPHFTPANKLLWFGHGSNYPSLSRVLSTLPSQPRVVSNLVNCIQWSLKILDRELQAADIVLLPATNPSKSANRCVEAVNAGCFVVAEPHPALTGFPGIWVGSIPDGIVWANRHPDKANKMIARAQEYIDRTFAPTVCAEMWRSTLCA